jgi:uncharacterized repeat protein (TIGR01451 family)
MQMFEYKDTKEGGCSERVRVKKKRIIMVLAVLTMFAIVSTLVLQPAAAQTTLSVAIKSWDKIGIDANKPATEGPNHAIVQARICNTGSENATNVTANFTWNSTTNQAYIYLHPHERPVKNLGTLAPGDCRDVFYVVEMKRDLASKGKTRPFTLNVTSDNSTPSKASKPLTVVGLIGQSQDSVVFVNISNDHPFPCTEFEVIVWANTTRTVNAAGWPLEYDPDIIELVNVTIKTSGTLIRKDLYNMSDVSHANHYIKYIFHALNPGTTNINVLIQDSTGAAPNYHYTVNFETVGIPPVVIKSADIAVNKTINNRTTHINETVVFTITVTNNGPDDATGVMVADGLPPGLSYVSHQECPCTSYNPLTGNWTVGLLPNGSSRFLNITARVTQLGNFTNNVTKIAANEYDPDTANDHANATVESQPSADIKVIKIVDNPNPDVGENITYTIEVRNNGPNNATGIEITDGLPLIYVSNTTSQGTYDATTGIWSVGDLPVGALATLNITVTVNQSGFIVNTATKTALNEYDPNTANDRNNQTIYVPIADIALDKRVNNTSPNVGEIVVFTITITNNGPDDATDVEVSEGLPPGLSYISHEICPCTSYNPLTGNWTVGLLPNGSSRFLNITARVTQPGSITNNVTKTAANEDDLNGLNDLANQTIYVPEADLEINKTVNNTTPGVGTHILYTINVTNHGPDNATGVVLDILPPGILHVSNSTSHGTYNNATGLWNIGSLTNGTTATLTITANVTTDSPRTNTAELISVDHFDPDSTPNNHDPTEDDQDSATISPVSVAVDIEVNKTVNNSVPALYQHINYTIVVTNNGPSNATGVVVQDLLPPGLIHISNYTPNGTYDYTTGSWSIGDLLNGSSATLTITVNVTIAGDIKNTAVKTAVNEKDTNTTNDIDTETIHVIAVDIEVLKIVDNPTPNVGETINYTITVTNTGPDNATGVAVNDSLPPQLVHLSNTTSNGTYNNATGIWTIGPLTNGSFETLTITAQVKKPGRINNTAYKTGLNETDPNLSNDNHTQVIYTPSADIEVNKTVDNSSTYLHEIVVFTITVTNHGPDGATGVTVTDIVPPGLTLLSHEECPCTTYDPLTGVWTIGDIANGSSQTLKLTAKVQQLGTITNNATKIAANEYDLDFKNDKDNATINSSPSADIRVTKFVDNPQPNVGENITYTIKVRNLGPSNATGLEITDGLPANLTYLSNTTSQGTYDAITGVWQVGNVSIDALALLNITATVTKPGFRINTVELTAADQFDPNSEPNNHVPTENDQYNQTIYIPKADIELTKSVDNPSPYVYESVTYTITVTNKGPDTVNYLYVNDGLPAGLVFEKAVVSQGSSYNSNTGIWLVSELTNGSSATLAVTVNVTQVGAIQNTAEVIAALQYDPDSTPNNQYPYEDDQDSRVIIGTPLSVPVLTPSGLIALIGLLFAVATLNIRMTKRR